MHDFDTTGGYPPRRYFTKRQVVYALLDDLKTRPPKNRPSFAWIAIRTGIHRRTIIRLCQDYEKANGPYWSEPSSN